MADRSQRFESNAPGAFYVDASCVHCRLCQSIAPEHFRQSDSEGFVYRQPAAAAEIALCAEALQGCPVGAIGDDGLLSH
ncbi:MAG: ferredoxin [Verrucomicrobiae bacterium]|nr:ferredoxin [Verrucomicrobiae bacterium]